MQNHQLSSHINMWHIYVLSHMSVGLCRPLSFIYFKKLDLRCEWEFTCTKMNSNNLMQLSFYTLLLSIANFTMPSSSVCLYVYFTQTKVCVCRVVCGDSAVRYLLVGRHDWEVIASSVIPVTRRRRSWGWSPLINLQSLDQNPLKVKAVVSLVF